MSGYKEGPQTNFHPMTQDIFNNQVNNLMKANTALYDAGGGNIIEITIQVRSAEVMAMWRVKLAEFELTSSTATRLKFRYNGAYITVVTAN